MSKKPETLVNVAEVQCDSLPWSLRHMDKDAALVDATNLAYALNVLNKGLENSDGEGEWAYQENAEWGREVIMHLLVDKLQIARGVYKFPFLTHGDAPHLCERETDED